MGYDYDQLYGETRDALGAPTAIFQEHFDTFDRSPLRVLDVGCGQGRDALFIARLGHSVMGVDVSANGIRDLNEAAQREGLNIEGVVADIKAFEPSGVFDVLLLDRTLHMLGEADRLMVLAQLIEHVAEGGQVLIADETSNMAGFKDMFAKQPGRWKTLFEKNGYLFVVRTT